MNIRKISNYIPLVKDKYYVATTGDFYTTKTDNKYRFVVKGERKACKKRITQQLRDMENLDLEFSNLDWIDNTSECSQDQPHILLKDGTVIRRMYQRLEDRGWAETQNRWTISMFTTTDVRATFLSHRVVAHCFLDNVYSKDVHHIDGDARNNKISNLCVLTPEEHRLLHGKVSHYFNTSETIERHFNNESSRVGASAPEVLG